MRRAPWGLLAGDGIPAPQSEASRLGWPARSLGYCLSQRGKSFPPPPSFPFPLLGRPWRCSSSAFPGHRPQTTWVFFRRNSLGLRLPLASRESPCHPWDTFRSPPRGGDRLAPGPRKVFAFCLPKWRAPLPASRFLRGKAVACDWGSSLST